MFLLLKDRQYHTNWRCVLEVLFLSSTTPLGGQSYLFLSHTDKFSPKWLLCEWLD